MCACLTVYDVVWTCLVSLFVCGMSVCMLLGMLDCVFVFVGVCACVLVCLFVVPCIRI